MSDLIDPRPWATADLSDEHGPEVRLSQPLFRDLGGLPAFAGPAATVLAPDDNSLVAAALAEPGQGRVLVVDGDGSTRCALLGDRLGALAVENGWAGVVVHGYVRDARILAALALGVRALGAVPNKSEKLGRGERDVPLDFAGVQVRPGDWVYADEDGLLVAPRALHANGS